MLNLPYVPRIQGVIVKSESSIYHNPLTYSTFRPCAGLIIGLIAGLFTQVCGWPSRSLLGVRRPSPQHTHACRLVRAQQEHGKFQLVHRSGASSSYGNGCRKHGVYGLEEEKQNGRLSGGSLDQEEGHEDKRKQRLPWLRRHNTSWLRQGRVASAVSFRDVWLFIQKTECGLLVPRRVLPSERSHY